MSYLSKKVAEMQLDTIQLKEEMAMMQDAFIEISKHVKADRKCFM